MVRPLRTEPFSNRTAYEPELLVNRDRLGTKTAVVKLGARLELDHVKSLNII